ncbi:MAG: hypothetical protein Fur0032_20190 [Terrimicrobiaceae bacterium]
MNSSGTKSFRAEFTRLSAEIQALAAKNDWLWRESPQHPSLQFKSIGPFWSVRIGLRYRAFGRVVEDRIYWFWIGHHQVYDRLISHL